jgi:putative transposase
MQVFGLSRQIYQERRAFSPRRRQIYRSGAKARRGRPWRSAMSDGLSADRAAQAVGVPRPTLYRWAKDATPKSPRPPRLRPKGWMPVLRLAVERLRQDFPIWGRANLGPLVREQGFAVSDATVRRIIADLVRAASSNPCRPCAVFPTPAAGRPNAASPAACRAISPVGEPGGVVQLDTVFVNLTPIKAVKHFTAYDPIAKRPSGSTAEASSWPSPASSRDRGRLTKGVALYVPPPRSPQMNGAGERCNGARDTSSTRPTTSPSASISSTPSSTATGTSTTIIVPTALLQERLPPTISPTAPPRDPCRLICADPGGDVRDSVSVA